MLYPTVKYLLEDDTLKLHQKLLDDEYKLYNEININYSKLDKVDNDYDKELIDEDELTEMAEVIEDEIEECNRKIEEIEIKEYQLFDNLETLV